MKAVSIHNNQSIPVKSIPDLSYTEFLEANTSLVINDRENHCVNYFGFPFEDGIRLVCCIANDHDHLIHISSTLLNIDREYPSFSSLHLSFEKFEREIHENFGIKYLDHPWLKPVRFPFNQYDTANTIANYPFFQVSGEEIHEVGVGPIHAGVIEPGHFRFSCNGEQILHMEIQLGYQHRGIEYLLLEKKKLLQRTTIAESIAGDTVAGHTTAFINLFESLSGFKATEDLRFSRMLALELERIAMHTADLSALCTDIAYQLGSAVYGRLRTPIINFLQVWCGNRLAKGLLRPGMTHFPFTQALAEKLNAVLDSFEPDFIEMSKKLFSLPSALSRFEKTGVVSEEQLLEMGCVGMAARMYGVSRDVRFSHPHDLYSDIQHELIIKHHGDVYSRAQIRKQEIIQSIAFIREMLKSIPEPKEAGEDLQPMGKNMLALSLVEGWRGEICHCAITDSSGELEVYKVKDPSFHNWLALAMSVRNNEISDFPICNKSFNLSYCGHDL
ncbi:MAG: NADH-quinone oxidoreductase subunit C [Bacteroidetes bacterium]|nr:NADH-quinone oxidoreductase subunit C [Bacteroidota bacterium]